MGANSQFQELRGAVDSAEQTQSAIAERFARWDSLTEVDRQSLAVEIERLEARARRMLQSLGKAAAVWPDRAKQIAAARQHARYGLGWAAGDRNPRWRYAAISQQPCERRLA